MTKFIFVTGGVLSGLGKGTVAASIAKLLQFRGFSVSMIKCDPYLNVDAGTMNPIEHGENFVCEEVWEFKPARGFSFRIAEVDQDFGTYERFTGEKTHPSQNITSGQIYLSVILKERVGEYLGKTVQIIPHITNEIKRRILSIAEKGNDIVIVEIGGTVGDIEGMPFLEAIRQLRNQLDREDTFLVHVTYVPYLRTIKQLKTKPTQHSVQRLLESGLTPDSIVTRSEIPLSESERRKISLLTGVPYQAVISAPDIDVVYALPLVFEQQGFGEYIIKKLGLKTRVDYKKGLREWETIIRRFLEYTDVINIALVGKYTRIVDSYISINEALKHAGAHENVRVNISLIDAENYDVDDLQKHDGILLTPGFGVRATEGMIKAATYALREKIPFLGICFGAQLATVAFAREIMGWTQANTTEVNPRTPYPVVDLLPEQKKIVEKGGTMRLGGHKIYIKPNTKLFDAYKEKVIVERFRHRYHIIPEYAKMAEEKGLIVSAVDERNRIINAIELKDFWAVGVQFHPEYKSRPLRPSPIYVAFIKAVLDGRENK